MNNIKKINLWEWIIILSPFLVIFFYKITSFYNIETLCLWKLLTGKECPGCGITHAIISLLKLNFKQAYEYNPLVFIVFPILLFSWANYIIQLLKR